MNLKNFSSAIKKRLILISNIVTNFTFKNEVGKVFGYTNIYNFVQTTAFPSIFEI